ncbi:aspartyl/asparaginyl beta-hydroxylase domain-containing protein [Pseudoalteromonas fenneropenaei]|uniref:Aspartyl/asparaginyl beta-hydroxylase domain-containing protein n=1 Tax=Pseudoalteromonas fenneropenaei TaxID=1737459 RepID=A0ABV7CG80_9GAMM
MIDKEVSFVKLPIQLDANDWQHDLAKLKNSTAWIAHVNKQCYQGNWSALALTSLQEHVHAHPIMQTFSIENGKGTWCDLPVLQELPALLKILRSLPFKYQSVRAMHLAPGASIFPHRDRGLTYSNGCARLHIPLQYSDRVHFMVNDKLMPMQIGEIWYFNADQIHSVENQSDEDRINLVIDCTVNDWLKAVLSGVQTSSSNTSIEKCIEQSELL